MEGHNVATKILGRIFWLQMDSAAQFAALLDSISARMKQEKQANEVCCMYCPVCAWSSLSFSSRQLLFFSVFPFSRISLIPTHRSQEHPHPRVVSSGVRSPQVATPRKKRRKKYARKLARQQAREKLPDIAACIYPPDLVCCGDECCRRWKPQTVQAIRQCFKSLKAVDRREWALRHMQETEHEDGTIRKAYFMDRFPTTAPVACAVKEELRPRCCLKWFLFVLKVSTTFIYQPHVSDTQRFQVHLSGRVNTKRDKANAVVVWLKELARWACLEPDTDQIALPFASWKQVWEMYEDERRAVGLPRVSTTHFRRIHLQDERVRHIVLRRYMRFAKCNECVEYRRLRNGTRDEKELADLAKRERAHKQHVREERGSYWRRRDRGRRLPEKYMSVIIDGADQSAFGVPHFREKDHVTQGAHTMGVKIMGAIVHGFAVFAYTHLDHVKSGANATIDVLVRVLQAYKGEREKLPCKLYLQLDNTVKQCKNRYLMSFLAMLVEHGIFRECVVSFLPVGHTHEDIDQLFSRFAVALRKADFHSRLGLAKVLERSYHTRTGESPRIEHLTRWTNFSEWLEPHIQKTQFQGITKFRQFMVARNGSGETVIQAREQCASRESRFRGIRDGTAVTKPWTPVGAPKLDLGKMPPAQRRVLQVLVAENESDAEEPEDNRRVSQQKQNQALDTRERTRKVHKVRKGCTKLMEVKKTSPEDRASLEADLELLCGSGPLPLNLTHGPGALQFLGAGWGAGVVGDLIDSAVELDEEGQHCAMMSSGYAVRVGIHVAVLLNPKETDIHVRYNFAKVVKVDWARAKCGESIGGQSIVKVQWLVRTRSTKNESYRPTKHTDFLEPDTIQCEVEFTKYNKNKGMALREDSLKELTFFNDLRDINNRQGIGEEEFEESDERVSGSETC